MTSSTAVLDAPHEAADGLDDAGERHERELRRLGLLAWAVAGRQVAVLSTDEERSFTDGEAIFLADLEEHWLRASLIAQASLLAIGSSEPNLMTKLAGRRQSRLRYLMLEVARAVDVLGPLLPPWMVTLVKESYDGPVPGSARESLAWATKARRGVPLAPSWLGTIKPIKLLRKSVLSGGEPTESDKQGDSGEEMLRELDDEEESDRSRIMELFSAPIRNPFSSMLQRFLGMGRIPETGRGGAELPVGGRSAGPVGDKAKPAQFSSPTNTVEPDAAPLGYRYPEWDFRRTAYRADWCAVAEFDPPTPADDRELEVVDARDLRLRRQLARLGLAHERHRRLPEGDALDLTALIELMADRAAGVIGDPRVYETKRRTAHDLGVLVLLDATGSTGESAEGRRVFDEQRLLAARLTWALEELGDRVAMFAFYSSGREAVRYLRVKDFEDRFDHAAERRLGALVPGGYTRLGAAIRHGTRRLSEDAGTAQMLLVVIGDGLPYEEGYEHRYAQEDSHQALRDAVTQGVGCVCLSIRSSTETEILERVWGGVPHQRLEHPDELARHVRPLFSEALKGAAASRRRIGAPLRHRPTNLATATAERPTTQRSAV